MKEMELIRILMNERRGDQMIVLREKDGKRTLPIIIGIAEASAIKLKIGGIKPPRPMTHDLLKDIVDKLGARVKKVVIDKLESNTFYAKIILDYKDHKSVLVDARPSDSIALALRTEAPIFVAESVLSQISNIES